MQGHSVKKVRLRGILNVVLTLFSDPALTPSQGQRAPSPPYPCILTLVRSPKDRGLAPLLHCYYQCLTILKYAIFKAKNPKNFRHPSTLRARLQCLPLPSDLPSTRPSYPPLSLQRPLFSEKPPIPSQEQRLVRRSYTATTPSSDSPTRPRNLQKLGSISSLQVS